MDNKLIIIGTFALTFLVVGLYITNEINQPIPTQPPAIINQQNTTNWSQTQISINSIEISSNSVTVFISIDGPWDHWRIILDEDFPLNNAGGIEGRGVSDDKYTFHSISPGEHIVRVAAVNPAHQLVGQIVNQTFTIELPPDGQIIKINNIKFVIYKAFLVEELTEDDFIGLYDSLKTDQVIIYTFEFITMHEYLNDHVSTGTDVIWLNEKFEIILLESIQYCENTAQMNYLEKLENCQISRSEGKYLVETHTNFIEKHKISLGDIAEIQLIKS